MFSSMRPTKIACVSMILWCVPLSHANESHAKPLPPGVLQAMANDEKEYCNQSTEGLTNTCREKFRANLLWRTLELTPGKRIGFLVENHNLGACGTAGCSLYLFVEEKKGSFIQVLGQDGDVGYLESIAVLTSITTGHFDILKVWADGKNRTIYTWSERRYLPQSDRSK